MLDNEGICHISAGTERSVSTAFEFPAYKKSLVVGISSRGNQHTAPRCYSDVGVTGHIINSLAEMKRLREDMQRGPAGLSISLSDLK